MESKWNNETHSQHKIIVNMSKNKEVLFQDDFEVDYEEHIFPNGDKYYGEFKDGEFHGQGTLTDYNGEKYVGEFKDGDYDGHGTFTSHNGGKYVGEFKNGEMNGQGTFTFPEEKKNTDESSWDGSRRREIPPPVLKLYEGEFKNGNFHGQGTLTRSYGSI